MLAWALNLGFAASGADAPPIIPDQAMRPAGRPIRRKRYYIEIDGQTFDVPSIADAETLLTRAKALALNHAQQAAEHIVSRGTQSGSKPIALPTPTIRSPNPELRDLIHETHEIINNVYRSTAIDAELAALLTRALAEQDEEEALLVLM